MKKRLKIGLALGCGGAKGLAHIGVLRVLEKNNIPIDYIAGSSIGSLIGGLYAAYGSIKPLEKILSATDIKRILSLIDPSFGWSGLLSGDKVEKFIARELGSINFKDLKIPFTAVATDLKTNKEIRIREGRVSSAIRSSVSVPLIFNPVKTAGKILIDGGLSAPVPVRAVRKMGADLVIAVDLDAGVLDGKSGKNALFKKAQKKLNLYEVAVFSLQVMRYHLAGYCVEEADWAIEPAIKDSQSVIVGWDKFISKDREKIIKAGEVAAEKVIRQIKKSLHANNHE